MYVELRLYAIPHGRMADIHGRMLAEVQPLFRRHGFPATAYWTALAGPGLPAFVWMIAWRDPAQREATWNAFYEDEEWWRIRAATNDGAELVESYGVWFMRPHALSPDFAPRSSGLHEMVVLETGIGRGPAVNDLFKSMIIPSTESAGGVITGLFDMVAGPKIPATVLLLSWPDFATRSAWHTHFMDGPELRAAGLTGLIGRGDTWLLRPERPIEPQAPAPIRPGEPIA